MPIFIASSARAIGFIQRLYQLDLTAGARADEKSERHCFNLKTAGGVEKYKVLQAPYQTQS
ncbi:hypothetical protein [Nitrosomonas sp. Nm33]|uniref:hypothetical protein n=1 Tax=Nitrosomonas sp. Nm33 TaxID=133724 RepID=UPI00089C5121|nr:hypothetical protein [Nitrosomonas sp. Nm33]SDY19867.1 hypothetical protein SAMN05421755_101110 [Nitrosomonas sp. Nm33]